ncbi:MAG: type II secretion system F family protein [Alphaproteobacteria bacterium]|nr:type II secretion system F family protein [Alphaproteobacteria bacterium]
MMDSPFLAPFDPALVAAIAGATAGFALMVAVALGLRQAAYRSRVQSVGDRAGGRVVADKRSAKGTAVEQMRQILTRLNLMPQDQIRALRGQLATAGYRDKQAIVVYLFAKLTAPAIIATGLAIVFYWMFPAILPGLMKLGLLLAAILIASRLPDIVVRKKAALRKEAIRKALPDALDLMVICAEAGLSLDAALDRVAKELQQSAPDLADEMTLTGLELKYLGDRRQAFDNFAARVDLAPVQALATTLVQTERFGTPIAQALRVLAAEQRTQRMMAAEEKAARLPATMTIPLVTFILPCLFAVLLGPAILDIIDGLSGVLTN